MADNNNDTSLLHYEIYYIRKKFYDHSYELSDAFVINLICIMSVKILILLPTILACGLYYKCLTIVIYDR